MREQLQNLIDEVIPKCVNYDDFVRELQERGVQVKQGKQLSFKMPEAKRFARQDTFGDDYSMIALFERMAGKRKAPKRKKYSAPPKQSEEKIVAVTIPETSIRVPKLLIDIETKLKQANSSGFEHWARIYNLKQMGQTLIYLRDNAIGTYDELNAKIRSMDGDHGGKSNRIKEIESRQKEISELQRQIGTYGKTKEAFYHHRKLKKYKQSKWELLRKQTHPADDYYEACRADITLCQSAKNYFNAQGYGKNKPLPTIQSLKEEYAKLEVEKRNYTTVSASSVMRSMT